MLLLARHVVRPLRRGVGACELAAILAMGALAPRPALAGEVVVAVAANFAGPWAKIARDFTAATGHVVKSSAGATGKFYTQITAGGAPFEVLIAADEETPRKLMAQGHAVPASQFTYAIGQLVLWSAQPGLVDEQGAVLASTRYTRLAIANPKVAPYGRAAWQTLEALGHAERARPRIVTADSIAQAYQFVATGNAEVGFVALSQVQPPGRSARGSMWRIPGHLHGEIRQDAVLLKAGAGNPVAAALLKHLQGPAAREVITSFGYR